VANNILKTITDFIKAIAPFVVAFLARRSGKQKERLDNAEKTNNATQQAKNVDSNIDSLPDDVVSDRLREKWTR
jgi:hypothetical protein